jgi:hypothetical protein
MHKLFWIALIIIIFINSCVRIEEISGPVPKKKINVSSSDIALLRGTGFNVGDTTFFDSLDTTFAQIRKSELKVALNFQHPSLTQVLAENAPDYYLKFDLKIETWHTATGLYIGLTEDTSAGSGGFTGIKITKVSPDSVSFTIISGLTESKIAKIPISSFYNKRVSYMIYCKGGELILSENQTIRTIITQDVKGTVEGPWDLRYFEIQAFNGPVTFYLDNIYLYKIQ